MIRADIHDHPADNGTALGKNGTAGNPISPNGWPALGRSYAVPAREGRAVRLRRGQSISVINTHGTQVCDLWAFNSANLSEYLSWEHTRGGISRISPKIGEVLLTNRRRAILTLSEDTSPGVHDTLIAACDLFRYVGLGAQDYHDNCSDNLRMALAALDERTNEVPQPFNVWMNIPVRQDGSIDWLPTVSKPGDRVTLRAEMDCLVVISACPQDMVPINGPDMRPMGLHFQVAV